MLTLLHRNGQVEAVAFEAGWTLPPDTVWIDLHEPTRAEELAVEAALGLGLPTREEMAEIEASSRLYQDRGATYMTATALHRADTDAPGLAPVTFVLAGDRLITIRYMELHAFKAFIGHAERNPEACTDAGDVFLGLLEAVVDRLADVLERTAIHVEEASAAIFRRPRQGGFEPIITALGRAQAINAKARDSLVSFSRLISFASLANQIGAAGEASERLKSLRRDVQSLTDHAGQLSGNVTFLLDAALGLINIEQNAIIKIFSVAAVVFLPPTLVASVYGMNFRHMPELDWLAGYPMALGLMVVSMLVPLWWFRRKGWL